MENKKNYTSPYDLDGKIPFGQALALGLQHVLAMFVGNLTPILLITGPLYCDLEHGIQIAIIQNAMLIAGLVTLVQLFTIGPVGAKLPIVMGTSSGFIGVAQSISQIMGGRRPGLWRADGGEPDRRTFRMCTRLLYQAASAFLPFRSYRNGGYVDRSLADRCRNQFFRRW